VIYLEYMKLGNSDLNISRVGFGCWAIGGHGWGIIDDAISIKSIQKALDLGINFFDTADVYGFGHSEEILAKALGSSRHDVVIATKFGVTWDKDGNIGRNCNPDYIVKALENSLRRLKIDCIPLYQIHWPDHQSPIDDIMEALLKCKEDGKIGCIGCSNFSTELTQSALETVNIESIQLPYSLIRREFEKTINYLTAKFNVSALAYDVLAKGLLTGKFNADSTFGNDDVRSNDGNFKGERFINNLNTVDKLKMIGKRYNKTPGQVAIRWLLDGNDNTCAITGIKKPDQIEENSLSLDWKLSREEWELLSSDIII
jgi:aryl-alcohol dehydrogenase-like predicted oxidoreductase